MNPDKRNLLHVAFDAYLVRLCQGELEPSDNYLSYDFSSVDIPNWYSLGKELVKDELTEITNKLNHWQGSLRRWQAWNSVIKPYGTDEAWELRREFLEALAHICLLMPSSIRDAFIFVATNSMHQVRLLTSKGYGDYLEGDPKSPGEVPKHLTRRKKEKRLADLISTWSEAPDFMASLRKIDDEAYRNATSDYRNLNSHSIGPRLGIGLTRAVVRSVKQATTMTTNADGACSLVPTPGKMSVVYTFGGTAPLDMEKAFSANLEQFRCARTCYESYLQLLAAGLKPCR